MSLLTYEFEKPACEILVESFEGFVNSICGFPVVEIQKRYAEIEMSLGVAGLELHRLIERLGGLRPATEFA
ncbi:MAG TPA: hypothetical protein VJ810_03210 [Blastocatellia bacterium]|nr:hypothetical protein [Blastocatellia bacterium]